MSWVRGGPRAAAIREQRAEELRQETGVFRCSHCAWTYEGSMADGITAARVHRREIHRGLPVKTPNPGRKKPEPKSKPKPKPPDAPAPAQSVETPQVAAAPPAPPTFGPRTCLKCGEVHRLGRGYARSHEAWELYRARNSAAHRGKRHSTEARIKMSAAAKAHHARLEPDAELPVCETCGQVHRRGKAGHFKSHEDWLAYREKMSASLKRRYAEDDELRARAREKALAWHRENTRVVSDETRAKHSAAAKEQHARRRAEQAA